MLDQLPCPNYLEHCDAQVLQLVLSRDRGCHGDGVLPGPWVAAELPRVARTWSTSSCGGSRAAVAMGGLDGGGVVSGWWGGRQRQDANGGGVVGGQWGGRRCGGRRRQDVHNGGVMGGRQGGRRRCGWWLQDAGGGGVVGGGARRPRGGQITGRAAPSRWRWGFRAATATEAPWGLDGESSCTSRFGKFRLGF